LGLVVQLALAVGLGIGGHSQWERHTTAHYAIHRIERTAQIRRTQGYDLPVSKCYIASPTLPIGTRVQVRGLNTGATLLCYVADVSDPKDRYRHIHAKDKQGREIGQIEVGYWEALKLCGSVKLPNRDCITLTRKID